MDDHSHNPTERALIEALDRAAGHPGRLRLRAKDRLLEEGEPTPGIWLIFAGEVELTRRHQGNVVRLDDQAAGDIIGLLSMTSRGVAFFTATATTDVDALLLPWDKLDAVLRAHPELREQFTGRLLRSLADRVRHVVELQATVQQLNAELRRTVHELEGAQTRLIETGRMASIGQLVAGIAHELNNPVTAIRRSADHVLDDVGQIVGWLPEQQEIMSMITSAISTPPISTADARAIATSLGRVLGDEPLARRLVALRVTTPDEARHWIGSRRGDERDRWITRLEVAYELGTFLRNLQSAGERVAGVVATLRNYAKAPQAGVGLVDLNRNLDDTIQLFAGAHKFVSVERSYDELPLITGDAGQLAQVWTNIITNAIEAMNGQGRLDVATRRLDSDLVRVSITDNGPGISPEHLQKVFDLNFTTKHGPSNFGLGMGLALSRTIVLRHGGHVRVESRPGRTSFVIDLPIPSDSRSTATQAPPRSQP